MSDFKKDLETPTQLGDEYAGILGGLRFFWRFRCVKLRLFAEIMGLISAFAFSLITVYATILQWYVPNHIMSINWNMYNESFVEYVWAIVTLPCILYFFKVSASRLEERHKK